MTISFSLLTRLMYSIESCSIFPVFVVFSPFVGKLSLKEMLLSGRRFPDFSFSDFRKFYGVGKKWVFELFSLIHQDNFSHFQETPLHLRYFHLYCLHNNPNEKLNKRILKRGRLWTLLHPYVSGIWILCFFGFLSF